MRSRSTTSGGRPASAARGDDFEYMPHVEQVDLAGRVGRHPGRGAAPPDGRRAAGSTPLFTIGFCFGGRLAFLTRDARARPGRRRSASTASRSGRAAAARRRRPTSPAEMTNPILGPVRRRRRGDPGRGDRGVRRGADGGRRRAPARDLRRARRTASSTARPSEFADASAQAWEETLTFVRGHTPSPVAAAEMGVPAAAVRRRRRPTDRRRRPRRRRRPSRRRPARSTPRSGPASSSWRGSSRTGSTTWSGASSATPTDRGRRRPRAASAGRTTRTAEADQPRPDRTDQRLVSCQAATTRTTKTTAASSPPGSARSSASTMPRSVSPINANEPRRGR